MPFVELCRKFRPGFEPLPESIDVFLKYGRNNSFFNIGKRTISLEKGLVYLTH